MFQCSLSDKHCQLHHSPEVPVKVEKALQGPHMVGRGRSSLLRTNPEF